MILGNVMWNINITLHDNRASTRSTSLNIFMNYHVHRACETSYINLSTFMNVLMIIISIVWFRIREPLNIEYQRTRILRVKLQLISLNIVIHVFKLLTTEIARELLVIHVFPVFESWESINRPYARLKLLWCFLRLGSSNCLYPGVGKILILLQVQYTTVSLNTITINIQKENMIKWKIFQIEGEHRHTEIIGWRYNRIQ